MFLNRLDNEEKFAFLVLAHYIARSDNDFNEDEKNIIKTYCLEMQMEDIHYDEERFDLAHTLGKFKNNRSQNIVLMEVMALVYADHFLHQSEKKVIHHMATVFSMSQAQISVSKEWAKSILSLYAQGEAIIEL